jgi:hypothetical protein
MKFFIYSPPYSSASGGTSALYSLCDDLRVLGYSVDIVLWGSYIDVGDSDIVIYPEVVSGNPLGGRNVVRYVLYREGLISGFGMDRGVGDFIFSWSNLYYSGADAYLLKYNIPDYFNDSGTKFSLDRGIDCTYIGKGKLYGDCRAMVGTIEINRDNAIGKVALAELLRVTRFLYTYDSLSSTCVEATLCGAIVVPLLWKPFSREEIGVSDLRFPYVEDTGNIGSGYFREREEYIVGIERSRMGYMVELGDIVVRILGHFGL